nr:hypothetical protein [Tanacetum cinerariifolium]
MTLNPSDENWYMDIDATSHMTTSSSTLLTYINLRTSKSIIVGNGNGIPHHGYGSTILQNPERPIYLNNVLYAPKLIKNLINVRHLFIDNNVSLEFDPFSFVVNEFLKGTPLMRCNSSEDLYLLSTTMLHRLTLPSTFAALSQDLWHHCFGHLGALILNSHRNICHSLHFGRPEFALITGLWFGTISFGLYTSGELKFLNKVFPHKLGLILTNLDVIGVIKDEEMFGKLCDEDLIRLCLLLALEVIFMDKIICDLNKALDSSHLHTFSSNQCHCFQCKYVLGDGEFCQGCTCMRCGSGISKGLCLICGNDQNSLNDSPSAHYGYNCPPKVLIIPNLEPFNNQTIDELQQTLPSFDPICYSKDESPFACDSTPNIIDDSPNVFNPPPQPLKYSYEFCGNDAYYGYDCPPQSENIKQKKEEEEKQITEEQAAKAQYWKISICYDEEGDYTIATTPKEPNNSLSMGDEHLNIIPGDMPACDDFTNFSNVLFDVDDDFSSSDDESFSDEDISKKIYSNPLFDEEIISMKIDPHHFNAESDLIESLLNHDSLIISSCSKIDSLLDEFTSELTLLKSIPAGINETDCDPEEEIRLIKKLLYDNSSPRLLKEFISKNFDTAIKSFSPSSIPVEDSNSFMEKIDLSFTLDDPMPPGIEEDEYDSERDILILEEFLSNDSLSLLENESFHFDIPSSSRPLAKLPDGDSKILNVKVMGDISKHNVPMPRLMLTQPTLAPNQEKSPNLLSHQGHKASQPSTECPMMIYKRNTPILDVSFLHFCPP